MGEPTRDTKVSEPFFLHSRIRKQFGGGLNSIRTAYGWTDEQILDQIEMFGLSWFEETIKLIIEEKQSDYKMLAMLIPLGRSPFGKEDGAALKRYSDNVLKALDRMTPWRIRSRRDDLIQSGMKPGEVVVQLGSGDSANDPLYKGAKIKK